MRQRPGKFSLAAAIGSALAFLPAKPVAQLSRGETAITRITIQTQPRITQMLPFRVQSCAGVVMAVMSQHQKTPGASGVDATCQAGGQVINAACVERAVEQEQATICADDNGTGATGAALRRDANRRLDEMLREMRTNPFRRPMTFGNGG